MALSFPYPISGPTVRSPGQGCSTCVHRDYCPAFYWYYRYEQYPSADQKAGKRIDTHLGLSCMSWSNNSSDIVGPPTADDIAENNRLNDEGILIEPFREGITDPVTANEHEQGIS